MGQKLKNVERIRPVLNKADLKAYVKLEAQSDAKYPPFCRKWTYQHFSQILAAHGIMAQSYVISSQDILHKEEVIGFILYRMHKDRFEILNLVSDADRPDVRKKLIVLMQTKAEKPNAMRKIVEFTVRETDEEWHRLLNSSNFKAELVREHFDHPVEDGYKFKWEAEDVGEPE